MKNILVISLDKVRCPIKDDALSLFEILMEDSIRTMKERYAVVTSTNIMNGYCLDEEVRKHRASQVILIYVYLSNFTFRWGLKKYFDDVLDILDIDALNEKRELHVFMVECGCIHMTQGAAARNMSWLSHSYSLFGFELKNFKLFRAGTSSKKSVFDHKRIIEFI